MSSNDSEAKLSSDAENSADFLMSVDDSEPTNMNDSADASEHSEKDTSTGSRKGKKNLNSDSDDDLDLDGDENSDDDLKLDGEEDSDEDSDSDSDDSDSDSGTDDTTLLEKVHKEDMRTPVPIPMEFEKETLTEESDVVSFFEHWLIDFKHMEIVSPLPYYNIFRDLYRCQQRRNDRIIWISNRWFTDLKDTQKFVRIARYCMQFIHPALVEMKGFAYNDMQNRRVPVVLYDNVDGIPLSEFLDHNVEPAKTNSAEIDTTYGISRVRKMILITGIASAIDYLHKKGIAHGRLDISNIIVNRGDLCPKIIAYGFGDYFQCEEKSSFRKDIRDFGRIAEEILNHGRMEGRKELRVIIEKCMNEEEEVDLSDVLAELENGISAMPQPSVDDVKQRNKLIKQNIPSQLGVVAETTEEYERYLKYLKTADSFYMKEFMSLRKVPLDYAEMLTDIFSFRKLLKNDAKLWDKSLEKKEYSCSCTKRGRYERRKDKKKPVKLDKQTNRSYLATLIWPNTGKLESDDSHASKVDGIIKKIWRGLQKGKYGLPLNMKASMHVVQDLCNHGYDEFSELRDLYIELRATPKMWKHFNLMATKMNNMEDEQGTFLKRESPRTLQEEKLLEIARLDMTTAREDEEKKRCGWMSSSEEEEQKEEVVNDEPTRKQILGVRRNLAFGYTGGESEMKIKVRREEKGLEFMDMVAESFESVLNSIEKKGAEKKYSCSSCYSSDRVTDVENIIRVAKMLCDGVRVPQDLEKAKRYCSLARKYWELYKISVADDKDEVADANKHLKEVSDVEEHIISAEALTNWKCELNGLNAMLEGFSFLHGINGCEKMPNCAFECYKQSTNCGMCSFVLGSLHARGVFLKDPKQMELLWKQAADNGDRKAQFLVNVLRHRYILSYHWAKRMITETNKYYGTFGEHPRAPDYTICPLQANVLGSIWQDCLKVEPTLDTYRSSSSTRGSKDRHNDNRVIYHFKGTYDGTTFNSLHLHWLSDPDCDVQRFVLGPTGKQLVAYRIAVGLEWLHDHKMISRNLDMRNIDYHRDRKGVITLNNFWPDRTSHSFDHGNSEFRAPELFHVDDPVNLEGRANKSDWFDEKVDVYSFGVLLCKLLNIENVPSDTGETEKSKLFMWLLGDIRVGDRRRRRRTRDTEKRYAPNWESAPHINDVAKGLIERCMDPNPAKRPSFEEITNLLRQFYILDDVDPVEFEKHCQALDSEGCYSSREVVLCEQVHGDENDTVEALLYVADSYLYGENGFPFNYSEACKYYERLANKKNPYGEFMFAYLAANGLGMSIHVPTAHRYYQRAIEHTRHATDPPDCHPRHKNIYQRATLEYALLLKKVAKRPHRDPIPFRFDEMIKEVALTGSDPDFWYQHGLVLESNFNFYVGEVMALAWYQKGADVGHFESLYRYCVVLLHADYLGDFVEYGKHLAFLEKTDEISHLVEFCKIFNDKCPKDERKREMPQRVRDRITVQLQGNDLCALLEKMIDITKDDSTKLEPIIMETAMRLSGENGNPDMVLYIDLCARLAKLSEWRYLSYLLEATTIEAVGKRFREQTKLIMLGQYLAMREKQHDLLTLFEYAMSIVKGEKTMRFADNLKYFAWMAATNERRHIFKVVTVIERMLEREWHSTIDEISEEMENAIERHPEFQGTLDDFVKLDDVSLSLGDKDPSEHVVDDSLLAAYQKEGLNTHTREKLIDCYRWFKIALGYIKASCDLEYKKAYIKMGQYIEHGRGTQVDIVQALVWYTRACNENKKNSRPPLLKLIDKHWDVVKNLIVCEKWDEKIVKGDGWEQRRWWTKEKREEMKKKQEKTEHFKKKHKKDMDVMRKRFIMQSIINDAWTGAQEGVDIAKFMMKIDTNSAAIYAHNRAVEKYRKETQFYTALALLGGHSVLKSDDYIGVSTELLSQAIRMINDSDAKRGKRESAKVRKFKRNKEKGLHYLYNSCVQGYIPACYHYGMLLIKGRSKELHVKLKIDAEQGMGYLKTAAKGKDAEFPKGYAPAQYEYGRRLFEGDAITQDIHEAFKYLKASADQGNKDAMYLLSNHIFCSDKYNLIRWEEARCYLEAAAQGSDRSVEACYELALQLVETGTESKIMRAAELLHDIKDEHKKAAKELKRVLKQMGTSYDELQYYIEEKKAGNKPRLIRRKSIRMMQANYRKTLGESSPQ